MTDPFAQANFGVLWGTIQVVSGALTFLQWPLLDLTLNTLKVGASCLVPVAMPSAAVDSKHNRNAG